MSNPAMLEDGLHLVGRQSSAAGGALDLLGVDSEGRLVVFELKRGKLSCDAVSQVIDYASDLNSKSTLDLCRHVEMNSGKYGIEKIDGFENWYGECFPEEDIQTLRPPRMVLVGLGADEKTQRMVNFLASGGMDVSMLTFHGFVNSDGTTLLARNIEVDSTNVQVNPKPGARRGKAIFAERVKVLPTDIRDLLVSAERFGRDQMRWSTTYYTNTRINFALDFSWQENGSRYRATLFVEVFGEGSSSGVAVGFYPAAIGLASSGCFDNFKQYGVEIERAPSNARPGPEDIDYEIKICMRSIDQWDSSKNAFEALIQELRNAYNSKREAGE